MADHWHYRILGEDFGPVSEATVRSLLADGTIGPSDEIRPDGSAGWQRADSLAGLVGDEAAEAPMDLDALLAPSGPVAQPTTKTSTDQWFSRSAGVQHGPFDFDALFQHVAEGTISRDDEILAPGGTDWVEAQSIVGLFPEDAPDLGASRQTDARRWYYRVLNQELGPVDLESLYELVREGNLRPDDELRGADETEWQRADSMAGLFPEEVVAAPPSAVAAGDEEPELKDDEEPEWYFKFDDDEMGPVTFGRLMQMAAKGRLQPPDPIRLTKLGNWMEAGSMVGLFPEEEPVEESPSPAAAPKSRPPKGPPLPADGDADDWAAAILSEPEPEPPPAAVPERTEEEPEPVVATAAPSPRFSPPSPSLASAPARPAFVPPPKAKRSSPSFSMPSMPSMPSGLGDLAGNPLVLGGAAVALLVVGFMFIPWGSLFAPPADDLVVRIDEIWGQVKPLYERRAPESEWATVAAKVDPQLKEIAEEATDRGAGADRPALQIVQLVARDYLPEVMEKKQGTDRGRIQMIDTFMERAQDLTK